MTSKATWQRALCPSGEIYGLAAYEWRADRRDLLLDGRHWRELFGGSIGDAPRLGGYVCCGPAAYTVFRGVCALSVIAILILRAVRTCSLLSTQLPSRLVQPLEFATT